VALGRQHKWRRVYWQALEADSSLLARALIQEAMGAIRESEGA
jgi:hypothetical protein